MVEIDVPSPVRFGLLISLVRLAMDTGGKKYAIWMSTRILLQNALVSSVVLILDLILLLDLRVGV